MAKSSARGRSLTPPQVVSMLVVFLTLSCVGGVLSAGFAAPFVGATAALTKASAELFEELPSDFNVQPPSQISTLLASDGSEITKFYAENRIVVPLSSISVNMQNAIVAVEDQRFYQHQGVDPTGMVRALVSNNAGGSRQGASTLTQQYVRNTLIETGLKNDDHKLIRDATESTVARKLREMKFALSLEQTGEGCEHGGHLGGCEFIRLVEHAECLRAGGGKRHHEVAVDDGVGVFLGVDNPDEYVHVAHHAGGEVAVGGGDRVEVGHVQQDEAAGAGAHFAASTDGSADAVEESGRRFGDGIGCSHSPGCLITLGCLSFGGERLSLRVDALVDTEPVK